MDLLPFVKDFGLGSGLALFFVLYIREVARHDETRKGNIGLIRECITAILSNTAALNTVTELVREGRRNAAPRKD